MYSPPDRRSDFIQVKSQNEVVEISKARGGPKYDPEENARKNAEIRSRNLDSQFRAAVSSIQSKRMRDEDKIYIIIEMDPNITPSKRNNMLNAFSEEIHAYLDMDNNSVLISIKKDNVDMYMERDMALTIKEPMLKIRELNKEDIIDKQIIENTTDENYEHNIIIHIMPNLPEEKNASYRDQLLSYIKEEEKELLIEPDEKSDMLFVKADISGIEKIVDDTNYVFKIEPIPAASDNNLAELVEGPPCEESLEYPSELLAELPTISVFDTGCDLIAPLNQVLINRDHYPILTGPDDSNARNGHGTPIAFLASFGETQTTPRAKINSYKIYDPSVPYYALPALMVGINRYPHETSRIYTSSIVYNDTNSIIYAKLNNEIQEKNICFVSSAGNIELTRAHVSNYPHYIFRNEIVYPSKLPNVIGVGGITKKAKTGSIAPIDELSPITRTGSTVPGLFSIKKPEVVEHGGNICRNGDKTDIGVESYSKHGVKTDIFLGTSFAAPLIAGRIAEIARARFVGFSENVGF